ncbi:MAG: response regulator [Candidatus Omnitrophota bacterium]
MKKVLIAEDEVVVAELFKEIVEDLGYSAYIANSGEEAIESAIAFHPDVVFMDIRMEHRTAGIDACKKIKEKMPETKVYFLSAYLQGAFESELEGVRYDGYIDKLSFTAVVEGLLKG